jgi:tripartite-type tricarboxylate transporter receptor subunit TctC
MHTFSLARRLLLAAAASLTLVAAHAQTYPARPVTLMVPYPAGGLSDVLARMVNTPLSKQLGQPVIVENLGGVSGAIAAQKVLNAPADGYYVFQGSPNELILSPLANAAVKFKSEDFRLVQMIGAAQIAVYARPDLPASSMDELIEYARKGAREGRPLTYASVGPGSFYHLLGEQLSKLTGIPMTHVPYKGGAPANQDLIGSQVDIFITVYGKSYQQLADSGKIKILAMLNSERIDSVRNIPSINETRALRHFTFNIWTGYFVRKDTPEPVVQALHKAITATLNDPAVREGLEANSLLVAKPAALGEVGKVYADGIAQFRAIAKSINLQPQ